MFGAHRVSRAERTFMKYDFVIDTYQTERVKVLSIWSECKDEDLPVRPLRSDPRGRSVHEQMVHQCVSEDAWFRTMLGIDVGAPPLPQEETRTGFIRRYAEDSGKRLAILREKDERWWEGPTRFFDVERSRAWVMTRRLTHTSHHRGQQMAMLRMLGREVHSNYGPTADPARDLARLDAPRDQRVGNQCSMTTPGYGLSAHQHDPLALCELNTSVKIPPEHRGLHAQ